MPSLCATYRTVSIHALLAECDRESIHYLLPYTGFNPRTPCGVRPVGAEVYGPHHSVSIHALLAECDTLKNLCTRIWTVSIHALLAECDA